MQDFFWILNLFNSRDIIEKQGQIMKLLSRLRHSKLGSSIEYKIKPRKVKFEWQDTPVDWVPNQPFVSYFINEINMILPAGE